MGGYRFNGRKIAESISIIALIILLLVTLLRFDVGYDYSHYYNFVINERIDPVQMVFLEPSARLIIEVTRYIGFPPAIIMIYGTISILFIWFAVKYNSNNIPLSLMVFIGLFYLSTICFIRQGASLGIILFSYPYVRDGKFLKFLICCAGATLLHYSAIIVLVAYFLYNKFSYKKLGLILLISFPTIMFFISILPNMFPNLPYINYLTSAENLTGGNMAKYVFLIINLSGLILSWKINRADLIKFFEVALIGSFFPFILGGHIGGRIGWYFMIFIIIALPNVLKYYPKSLSRLCNAFMAICFLGMVFVSSRSTGKTQYTPYQTLFQVDLKNPKFKEE